MAKKHQQNSPEVEHRLDAVTGNDAQAEHRANLEKDLAEEKEAMDARHERALAMAAPVQKVTDGNETAALATITGAVPVRDLSDAPPPAELGVPADADA